MATQYTNYRHHKEAWGESGWSKIILPLIDYCELHKVEIHQIKEKFGTLRFYTGAAPNEFYLMVQQAENQSGQTCEVCGRPGKNEQLTGWYTTRCPEHKDKG